MDLWPKNQFKIAPQFIIKFTPFRLKYLEKIIEIQNHCQNETLGISRYRMASKKDWNPLTEWLLYIVTKESY